MVFLMSKVPLHLFLMSKVPLYLSIRVKEAKRLVGILLHYLFHVSYECGTPAAGVSYG